MPFASYYSNTSVWSLKDLLETVMLAAPAGLWIGWRRWGRPPRETAVWALLAGLALGGVLEAAQLCMKSRHPGITDALSFGIGSAAGSYCLALTEMLFPHARQMLAGAAEDPARKARRILSEQPHTAERCSWFLSRP